MLYLVGFQYCSCRIRCSIKEPSGRERYAAPIKCSQTNCQRPGHSSSPSTLFDYDFKRATGTGLKLGTRRIVKQINSHFGTLYYWHSVHSPDYQWYLQLEVWEGGRVPASVSPRCPGKPRRWPWVSVHRAPARCTQTPLHLLLRPALQLHPEPLFSATRPKVSPSLVPPAKRIISNDLAGGLAAAVSLLLSACPNSWILPPLDPD